MKRKGPLDPNKKEKGPIFFWALSDGNLKEKNIFATKCIKKHSGPIGSECFDKSSYLFGTPFVKKNTRLAWRSPVMSKINFFPSTSKVSWVSGASRVGWVTTGA